MAKNTKVADKPALDPTLPDVELVLGGQTFKLCFDFNAVVHAEKITGVNLLTSIVEDITATSLRGLLYAAVLRDQPDVTIEHVGSLISPTNIGAVRTAIVTAWFGSIKSAEGKD